MLDFSLISNEFSTFQTSLQSLLYFVAAALSAHLQRATWVSIGLSTVFADSMSVMFLLFPKQVIGIYLDVQNPENLAIVSLATTLLVIAAIAQVLDAFQKAIYGSLQGLQDTQVPMVLIALGSFLGLWAIGSLCRGFLLQLGHTGIVDCAIGGDRFSREPTYMEATS